jgi:hypothetical protein
MRHRRSASCPNGVRAESKNKAQLGPDLVDSSDVETTPKATEAREETPVTPAPAPVKPAEVKPGAGSRDDREAENAFHFRG